MPNIFVIADEAHRSQYDLIDGLARNLRDSLPHASFIGFIGTPIEKTDANTRAVFVDLGHEVGSELTIDTAAPGARTI